MSPHSLEQMLDAIASDFHYTRHAIGRDRLSERVLTALRTVPRHLFVPTALREAAYDNAPLPIGEGQTISQPYIVAVMTECLDLESSDRVLEIGTGCGYQTAILAELVATVYSIEINARLASVAAQRLDALAYRNVHLRTGDGYNGWQDAAPFDAVMITAAARSLPQPVLQQLKIGGKLIAPIETYRGQDLMLFHKRTAHDIQAEKLLPVVFVPLTGKARTPNLSVAH